MYISDILNWREATTIMFKVPTKKLSQRIKTMITEIQTKINVELSPEEVNCKIAMNKFRREEKNDLELHMYYISNKTGTKNFKKHK